MNSIEKLKNYYYEIYRIRKVELKISDLYNNQQMRCPVHLSIGQEGAAVGVCSALSNKDKIFSAHRSHAHYLAKGGDLKAMISELYGKKTGCAKGLGGSMHLFDLKAGLISAVPIVGSTIPIAAGYAWSNKLKNKNIQTVVFFGEGATETGVFHETLNFASLHNLPIIFVCENNLYSVYTHIDYRQSKQRSIKMNVKSFNIKYFEGNGNNVLEVNKLTNKALNLTKQKKQPVFLNFDTYRTLEHCGPNNDDYLNYRNHKEIDKWKKNCPLEFIEKIIRNKKIKLNYKKIQLKVDKEINDAFDFAIKSKFPPKSYLKKYIYS